MIGSRWRKVARDLWQHRIRTLLVVLSIAAGVGGVGSVAQMRSVISRDLERSYADVRPANATLYTDDAFDDELVRAVRRVPGIADAEGRRSLMLRFRTGPEREWRLMELFVLPDDGETRVSIVRPEPVFDVDPASWNGGAWPPPRHTIVLERTSLLVGYLGLAQSRLNDTITIETADGRFREARLAGLAYDFSRLPATFAGRAYGYVDRETLEWLGGAAGYNELYLAVDGVADEAGARLVAERVRTQLDRAGIEVTRLEVATPGKLPLDNYFQAITLVLGALGVLALLLSVLLVTNTMSALLAQQTRQIGVMKAVGARAGQIVAAYAVYAFAFGLLALPLALLGTRIATNEFVAFLAYFLNFQLGAVTTPFDVFALQIGMALLVPQLAALIPVLNAARLTVREALAGGHEESGKPVDDQAQRRGRARRMMAAVARGFAWFAPRPLMLAIRNTFRRRVRLTLTLTTLTLAGTVVIAVLSVRGSMFATFEDLLAASDHDIQVSFIRPYRTAQIERVARQVPGVTHVESWSEASVFRLRPDGSEGPMIALQAPPATTALFTPEVVEGRWLRPDDDQALVISADVRSVEPDLQVGQRITLKIGERETEWRIVGVVRGMLGIPISYAPQDYFAQVTGDVGRTREARLVTEAHDAAMQQRVAAAFQEALEAEGFRVAVMQTRAEQREQSATLFNIIVSFLLTMAVLLATVGGLGLMGTMSLNVIERTREIGVMRAIGASNRSLYQVIVGEGLTIGLISAAIAALLAAPLGYLLSIGVGLAFFQVPLSYQFAFDGVAIWVALAAGIGAAASAIPARSAVRLTVRDTLAYDG